MKNYPICIFRMSLLSFLFPISGSQMIAGGLISMKAIAEETADPSTFYAIDFQKVIAIESAARQKAQTVNNNLVNYNKKALDIIADYVSDNTTLFGTVTNESARTIIEDYKNFKNKTKKINVQDYSIEDSRTIYTILMSINRNLNTTFLRKNIEERHRASFEGQPDAKNYSLENYMENKYKIDNASFMNIYRKTLNQILLLDSILGRLEENRRNGDVQFNDHDWALAIDSYHILVEGGLDIVDKNETFVVEIQELLKSRKQEISKIYEKRIKALNQWKYDTSMIEDSTWTNNYNSMLNHLDFLELVVMDPVRLLMPSIAKNNMIENVKNTIKKQFSLLPLQPLSLPEAPESKEDDTKYDPKIALHKWSQYEDQINSIISNYKSMSGIDNIIIERAVTKKLITQERAKTIQQIILDLDKAREWSVYASKMEIFEQDRINKAEQLEEEANRKRYDAFQEYKSAVGNRLAVEIVLNTNPDARYSINELSNRLKELKAEEGKVKARLVALKFNKDPQFIRLVKDEIKTNRDTLAKFTNYHYSSRDPRDQRAIFHLSAIIQNYQEWVDRAGKN